MSEANLNSNMAATIRKRGGWARKMQAGLAGAGLPDVIGVYRGVTLFLEGKLPGKENTLTKLQAETLAQAKKAGAVARVITSTDQVKKLLDAIDRKKDGHRPRKKRP